MSHDEPLDETNQAFHAAYAQARTHKEEQSPVFVVLPDTIVLFRGEERREAPYTSPAFHMLKAAAHAPIGLYAIAYQRDAENRPRIAALRTRLEAALADRTLAREFADEPAALSDLRLMLERTRRFIDTLEVGPPSAETLAAFASDAGALLPKLIDHATRIQLAALHDCVEELTALLSSDERRTLQVAVTGDHQARARNLGMQYFQARFGEAAEDHLVYAEGVREEKDALELIGSRRLDAVLARAFFGDAKRLQRDVLGDAVRDRLRAVKLSALL